MLNPTYPIAAIFTLCLGVVVAQNSPIRIELFQAFASFTNSSHAGNRLGYRFHEHTPLIYGEVPKINEESGTRPESLVVADFKGRPGVKAFHRRVTEEGWVPQDWTFYLAPVGDGIELLLIVQTGETGLPEFYGIQQCFRLSGASNEAWRHKYARTPAFSEFDLWQSTLRNMNNISLTSVLRNGALATLPAGKESVGCRTAYGQGLDMRRSNGHLDALERVGPYNARMLWTCDNGLVLRTSQDGQWSTGIYWERTTHISDHHPADCLHAIVNIGGVAPRSQRVLRGKIYWLPASGDIVLEHWRKDFLQSQAASH